MTDEEAPVDFALRMTDADEFNLAMLLPDADADAAHAAMREHDSRYNAEGRDGFAFGFAAGLKHARTWRPLTEDPATWPEEGQWVLLRSAAVKDGPDLQRWFARRRSQATRCSSWARPAHWTHWAPLPAPPEQETR
jgi:hypothetical protein